MQFKLSFYIVFLYSPQPCAGGSFLLFYPPLRWGEFLSFYLPTPVAAGFCRLYIAPTPVVGGLCWGEFFIVLPSPVLGGVFKTLFPCLFPSFVCLANPHDKAYLLQLRVRELSFSFES
jgi:hypothetical protein